MDDEFTDLLRRASPRTATDDPAVAEAVAQLVGSAARTGRIPQRQGTSARYSVGIVLVAAASLTLISLMTGSPSGGTGDSAGPGPTPAVATPVPSASAGVEASADARDCFVSSEVTADPATADADTARHLKAARDYLVENDLALVTLEGFAGSHVPSPDAVEKIVQQSERDIEAALADAGYLRPGMTVRSLLGCEESGAP